MVNRMWRGIAWLAIAITWVVVFAYPILDILWSAGVSLTYVEEDVIEYLPAIIFALLGLRDLHKAKVF